VIARAEHPEEADVDHKVGGGRCSPSGDSVNVRKALECIGAVAHERGQEDAMPGSISNSGGVPFRPDEGDSRLKGVCPFGY